MAQLLQIKLYFRDNCNRKVAYTGQMLAILKEPDKLEFIINVKAINGKWLEFPEISDTRNQKVIGDEFEAVQVYLQIFNSGLRVENLPDLAVKVLGGVVFIHWVLSFNWSWPCEEVDHEGKSTER